MCLHAWYGLDCYTAMLLCLQLSFDHRRWRRLATGRQDERTMQACLAATLLLAGLAMVSKSA